MSDPTDDLTHYMEATARMRERAEKAEAKAERLRAAEAECRNSRGFVAAENERLRAVAQAANSAFLAFAKAPPELADDLDVTQAMSTLGAALDSYDTLRESWSR